MDSYLEAVLTGTVEQSARARAMQEARAQADRLNQVVDSLQANPEGCVKELVGEPRRMREGVGKKISDEPRGMREGDDIIGRSSHGGIA